MLKNPAEQTVSTVRVRAPNTARFCRFLYEYCQHLKHWIIVKILSAVADIRSLFPF